MLNNLKRWLSRVLRWKHAHPPAALWHAVESRLPFLAYLPDEARARLRRISVDFLDQKKFFGTNGFELGDEIMLSIAIQASLPILKQGISAYRDWVGIVVYSGEFVARRQVRDIAGVVHEFDDILLGQAREDGPVLVAWFDERPRDGVNVIIHEFAHKLDMANGHADGYPALLPGMSRQTWARDFTQAYNTLCERVNSGVDTTLDPYATTSPAEFFAVASQAFFETTISLETNFPAVYAQLSQLYGIDTAAGERLTGC